MIRAVQVTLPVPFTTALLTFSVDRQSGGFQRGQQRPQFLGDIGSFRFAEGIGSNQSGGGLVSHQLELALRRIERLVDLLWIWRLGITQQHLDRRMPAGY